MTLKKKLAVSSLAVSLAAASVAGLPVGQSLESVLGSGVASAATGLNADQILVRLAAKAQAVNAKISSTDKVLLAQELDRLKAINSNDIQQIFSPLLNKLDLNETEITALSNLYAEIVASVQTFDVETARAILNSSEFAAAREVLKDAGLQMGISNLTVADLYSYFLDLEGKLITAIKNNDITAAAELALILAPNTNALPAKYKSFIADVKLAVLDTGLGTQGYTVREVYEELGLTDADTDQIIDNIRDNDKLSGFVNAAVILGNAYFAAVVYPPATPQPPVSGGGGGGTPAPTTPTTPTVTEGVVTVPVTVVDGVATANVTLAAVTAGLASAAQAGLDTLTLDLGTITAPTVKAPLSKEILDAVKANPTVENVTITFNGLSLTIPVAQFNDAIELTVTTAAPSTIASVTTMNVASDVYEFGFTVGGVETTTFRQPLTLTLPLKNAAGLDQELLSVVKIINNALQAHGGVVEGNTIVEPRDSFSTYTVVENKVTFSDIASVQAWAGRQIQVVAAKGAIEGVGNGVFAPKANVTRAEFAKMLVRALNLENNSATESFADVQPNDWFAPYVAVAAEKGIITGRSATVFDPSAPISRAEMATMIARAVKLDNPAAATDSSILAKFADAGQISAALRDGVQFAASHNLVIGSDGKFYPNNTATRAEAAVIIYRTINFE